jgi:DNA-binding NarL/FixJ family response regulator
MENGPFPDVICILSIYTISMIKILVVDEEASIRRGLRMRLNAERDFIVVGETGDGWEAIQLVRELQPDVVLTGIRLPGMDGIALTERLHRDFPGCAVVILNLYDDQSKHERALKVGASAIVSNKIPNGELMDAIRKSVRISK